MTETKLQDTTGLILDIYGLLRCMSFQRIPFPSRNYDIILTSGISIIASHKPTMFEMADFLYKMSDIPNLRNGTFRNLFMPNYGTERGHN